MKLALIFISLSFTLNLCAQNDSVIIAFSAGQQKENVILNWTIAGGNTCSGIEIFHSTDSSTLKKIYDYPGVCGSNSSNESYSYAHETPANKTKNYYQLFIASTNTYSKIISTNFFSIGDKGFEIYPQPSYNEAVLYFSNPDNNLFTITVMNQFGQEIFKKENIDGNFIKLNKFEIGAGLYYFNLTNSTKKYTGSLLFL